MNVNDLVRNADMVHQAFKKTPDGLLVATKECKIQIPARFTQRNLAEIGTEIFVTGLFALIVDKYYTVCNFNAKMRIEPYKILTTKINDTEYYEFYFEPGQLLTPTVNLIKDDILLYYIFDEIFSKGGVPWYLDYEDLGRIFDTAKYHSGSSLGDTFELTELITSLVSRNQKDRMKYYRTTVKGYEDLITDPPVFVPLKSVIYSATNTLNKIAGSYINDGIVSALTDPTDRVERIEDLLTR